jgi:hypothetical protein
MAYILSVCPVAFVEKLASHLPDAAVSATVSNFAIGDFYKVRYKFANLPSDPDQLIGALVAALTSVDRPGIKPPHALPCAEPIRPSAAPILPKTRRPFCGPRLSQVRGIRQPGAEKTLVH